MKTSHTALLNQLSLWELPALQESIVDYVEMQVRPVSSFSLEAPIKFYIPSAKDEYILLNQSELYVKMKIQVEWAAKATPSIAGWDGLIPADNFLHSIFKKVNLLINNYEVTDDSTHYGFKSYFESYLGWSAEAKKSDLSSVIYNRLSSKRHEMIKPFISADFKSVEFWVGGPLHLDLSFQKKALLGGCDVMLELVPNVRDFFLHSTKENFSSIKASMSDIVYYVHKAKVSKELEAAHQTALTRSPARYPYTRSVVKAVTVPSGLNSCSLDNVFMGPLPKRIFIGIIPEKTYNGDLSKDTMNFIPSGLSRLAVFVDGRQYPNTSFQPSFVAATTDLDAHGDTVREYRAFLKALNQNNPMAEIDISLSDWWNNPIYGFNFNPDLSNGAGSHVSPPKNGQLNIKADFKTALTEAVIFLVFAEFDKLLEIDRYGQVSQS